MYGQAMVFKYHAAEPQHTLSRLFRKAPSGAITKCSLVQQCAGRRQPRLGFRSESCLQATSEAFLITLLPFCRQLSLTSVLSSVSHHWVLKQRHTPPLVDNAEAVAPESATNSNPTEADPPSSQPHPSTSVSISNSFAPVFGPRQSIRGCTVRCARAVRKVGCFSPLAATGPRVLNSAPYSPCWYTRDFLF